MKRMKSFCETRWKIHGAVLAFLMVFTFFGGFYLLDKYEYEGEDDKYVIPMFNMMQNTAGINLHQISSHVLPAVVGISDKNNNIVSSGVIVNPRGYIVTTWHSISALTTVKAQVRTATGVSSYDAEVIRIQAEHDLVLLKLNTKDRFLYMAVPASSEQLWTDQVAAFGMGAAGRIVHKPGTMGSLPVSLSVAKVQINEMLTTTSVYTWEQTGGPLVDARAQLVGINLAIKSSQNVIEGYAIPSRFIYLHFKDWLPGTATSKKKVL
jgi:serine protease Do